MAEKHILKIDPVFWPVNTHKWKLKTGMEIFLKRKKISCSSVEKGYNLVDNVPMKECPDGFILDGQGNLILKIGSTDGYFRDTGVYDPKYEGFVETEYVIDKKTGEQKIKLHDVSWYTVNPNGTVTEHNIILPDDPRYDSMHSERGLGCQNVNLSKKDMDIEEVRKKLKEIPEPEKKKIEKKEELSAKAHEVRQSAHQTIWDIIYNLIMYILNKIK